jgi:hypothetical protein
MSRPKKKAVETQDVVSKEVKTKETTQPVVCGFKESFVRFLKLVILGNEITNKQALFNIKQDQIEVIAHSPDKSLGLRATLKADTKSDLGEVGICGLPDFMKCLDTLSDLKIDFLKNKINLISKKTKISVVLQDANYIMNKLDTEKFEKVSKSTKEAIKITITKDVVQEIIKYFDLIKPFELTLEGDKNTLQVLMENDYSSDGGKKDLTSEFKIEANDSFKFKVSKFFITLLNTIDNTENYNMTIELAKEDARAICLTYEKENIKVEYILLALEDKKEE